MESQLSAVELIHPKCFAVVLLTNLTDVWMFRWFSKKKIIQLHPKNAFKTVVSKRDWSVGKVVPYAVPIIPSTTDPFKQVNVQSFVLFGLL
jgi:hypothetical protein